MDIWFYVLELKDVFFLGHWESDMATTLCMQTKGTAILLHMLLFKMLAGEWLLLWPRSSFSFQSSLLPSPGTRLMYHTQQHGTDSEFEFVTLNLISETNAVGFNMLVNALFQVQASS